MRASDRPSGFTLIELSIVLVIIGLIVGGILVGRDMIEAAKVRATIAQYEKYKTAVYTFKTKYNAIPGDLTTTDATAIGFAPTTRNGGADGTGTIIHGDGYIEVINNGVCVQPATCPLQISYEGALFWQDLSSANLIDGSFNSATDANITPTAANVGNYLPQAKLGNNAYWLVWSMLGSPSVNGTAILPGNYFQLMGITPSGGTQFYAANAVTPIQAYNIDTKIDDGFWSTGIVRSSSDTSDPFFFAAYNGGWSNSGCLNATAHNYAVDTNPNGLACQLSFKAGF